MAGVASSLCGWGCVARVSGSLTAVSKSEVEFDQTKTSLPLSSIVFLLGGIFTLISLQALCWAIGIYMLCCSCVLILLEIPFLCSFVERAAPWIERANQVSSMQRGVFYLG